MAKGNRIPSNLEARILLGIKRLRTALRHNGTAYLFEHEGAVIASCREDRIRGRLIGVYTQGVPWEDIAEDIQAV